MKSFNQFVKSRDVKLSEMAAPAVVDIKRKFMTHIYEELTSLKEYLEGIFDDQNHDHSRIKNAPINWMKMNKELFQYALGRIETHFDPFLFGEKHKETTDDVLDMQYSIISNIKPKFEKLITMLLTTKKIGDTEHPYGSPEYRAAHPRAEADDPHNWAGMHTDGDGFTRERSDKNIGHLKELNEFINIPFNNLINKINILIPFYAPKAAEAAEAAEAAKDKFYGNPQNYGRTYKGP
jgi:hypothetical protein